jgi:hypothetical protein
VLLPALSKATMQLNKFLANFKRDLPEITRTAKQALGPLAPLFKAAFTAATFWIREQIAIQKGLLTVWSVAIRSVIVAARAVASAMKTSFGAASAAVRAAVSAMNAALNGLRAGLHGAEAAIRAVVSAFNALRSAASQVINFKIHVPHISFPHIGIPGRAAGGFIPGPSPGSPVPILAHAGEVVLNRQQQNMLGGPGVIARMFGFRGDEGPQFARGGFVKPRKQKKPPHRTIGKRAMATSRAGKAAEAAANTVYQAEQDIDTSYGQLSRQYSISPDEFGNALDVAEIDSLIAERGKLLAKIDEEKAALQKALAVLKQAVKQLMQAIKDEKAAIAADLKKLNAERKKRRPNKKLVSSLEGSLSSRRARLGTLQTELTAVRGDVATENRRLSPDLGFDRRNVELDIMELQQLRVDTLKSIAEAQASTDSGGGDSGGGGDIGGGGGGGADDQSGIVALLMEELGKLRLALGVQGVQVPIIGSFQRGILSVPQTGLAMVHAGEQITRAGRPSVESAGGDVMVNIHLDGNLEKLASVIDTRVDVKTPDISKKIGRAAETRRRSGRY